ncbi:MAG: hypothetical protein M3R44_02180 [Candidatus Eremiobacteraeota bacterium]|nr:hypothetical protein [Candidatus Eremiobacteraeota bacterium]
MTDDELRDYNGKPVRATLADGRVLAGTLHAEHDSGHDHMHYAIVSDPIRQGEQNVREVIHDADHIVQIQDAANDPAAVE